MLVRQGSLDNLGQVRSAGGGRFGLMLLQQPGANHFGFIVKTQMTRLPKMSFKTGASEGIRIMAEFSLISLILCGLGASRNTLNRVFRTKKHQHSPLLLPAVASFTLRGSIISYQHLNRPQQLSKISS